MSLRFLAQSFLRLALALGFSLLLIGPVAAQSSKTVTYRRASLGLDAGWGAPTGWGLTYSHMIGEKLDWTLGGGFNISGAKAGVGLRYYVAPERRLSPWFGTALVASSGISDMEIDSDGGDDDFDWLDSPDASRTYSIAGGLTLHLRSGLRWQPGRIGFLGALGYGINLSDPYRFPTTMTTADRRAARIFGPGGVEVSLGILVGLGK